VSILTVAYARNLGPAATLRPQEWTDESGRVALCCARCATVFELGDNRVEHDGFVVPAVACVSTECGEFAYVRLRSWAEEVLR
jgi:hypothetical protein